MPSPATATDLLALLRKSELFQAGELRRLLAAAPALPDDPEAAARLLVAHGVLTPFQAKLLLEGKYRGFRIGPYLIRAQIGQGRLGEIYLADHASLRRHVAVKVLMPSGGVTPEALDRFMQKAQSTAALSHPNIIQIHDVGRQSDLHYLVLEYIDGETLQQALERSGPVPHGHAADYVCQAALGLQHAHERGFVHRDVKPSNLMLSRDGVVKILDLGLARSSFDSRDKLTAVLQQDKIVGTADFIAPEQSLNAPDQDIRADVYSLGATFFTLLVGRPPFQGSKTQKLLQHQITAPPNPSAVDPSIPAELSAVVVRMMAKRPADRFAEPAEVAEALRPWRRPAPARPASPLVDQPTPLPTASTLSLAGPASPSGRRPWRYAAAAAVLLLGIAAAWLLSGYLAPPPRNPPDSMTAPSSCGPSPS